MTTQRNRTEVTRQTNYRFAVSVQTTSATIKCNRTFDNGKSRQASAQVFFHANAQTALAQATVVYNGLASYAIQFF